MGQQQAAKLFWRPLVLFLAIAHGAKCTLNVAKGMTSLASGSGPLFGSVMLLLLEACTLAYVAYGALQMWLHRFSPQRSSDWLLGWSFIVLVFNFTAHFSGAMPGFLGDKSFLAYAIGSSLAIAMLLPPAHALAHWAVASPSIV